jgi:hypothetical protein
MLRAEERSLMLMALALLAAIDAVPSPSVSLILTGGADRTPVSATPRSLSDVARELREGRKAVGGFSAVESTVPRSLSAFIPTFEPEPVTTEPEPEVVIESPPVYAPTYLPVWYGGGQKRSHRHQRPAAHFAAPRPASPPHGLSSLPPSFHPRQTTAGRMRQR